MAVAVVCLCLWSAGARADDWPQFRGADRDGRSAEKGLLAQWPEGGPRLLWSVRGVGQGFTHVSVAGGLVYVTGLVGSEGVLRAYTPDGKLKWEGKYGPEWDKAHPGARSIPTVHEGLVYVTSGVGNAACFEAAGGKRVWFVKLFEEYEAPQVQWGYAESPLVDGETVIFTPCGEKATLVALNRKTGTPAWASPALG
jgi:outer membrane protein assembly factor BamB